MQIYIEFSPKDKNGLQTALSKLEHCICEVKKWMNDNKLKFNDSKTEFMVLSSPHNSKLHKFETCTLQVGDVTIMSSKAVRNLGSVMDNTLTMEKNVTAVIQSLYAQLRKIGKLRRFLDSASCAKLVNSLVTSRLDYNNSLLIGIPRTVLGRLQVVQNHAARLVSGTKAREHITPVLRNLHWFPVQERIKYDMLLTVFKCLKAPDSPSYLRELLQLYVPSRCLRSSEDKWILSHDSRRNTQNSYGERAFLNYGPKLWNELPYGLRQCERLHTFKKCLKTHLFNCYFNNASSA